MVAPRVVAAQPHDHAAAVLRHELHRVGQQVQQHLQQPVAVRMQHRHLCGLLDLQLRAALAERPGGGLYRMRDQLAQVDRIAAPLGVAGLDLRHVQHLVDEAAEALGFRHHELQKLLALRCVHLGLVAHQLGERTDRSERRAQLVGHRRHEVVLQPVEAFELAVQRPHLRSFVEHAQDVLGAQRLLLHDAGHHRTRRRAADSAGELRLHVLDQPRVGLDPFDLRDAGLPRIVGEQPLRRIAAEKARRQLLQLGQPGAPAPEHRRWRQRGALEHVDEQQRLAGLARRRRARQRHHGITAGVGQQAPQQRMREAVQAGQAEQLLGAQQRDAKGSVRS